MRARCDGSVGSLGWPFVRSAGDGSRRGKKPGWAGSLALLADSDKSSRRPVSSAGAGSLALPVALGCLPTNHTTLPAPSGGVGHVMRTFAACWSLGSAGNWAHWGWSPLPKWKETVWNTGSGEGRLWGAIVSVPSWFSRLPSFLVLVGERQKQKRKKRKSMRLQITR